MPGGLCSFFAQCKYPIINCTFINQLSFFIQQNSLRCNSGFQVMRELLFGVNQYFKAGMIFIFKTGYLAYCVSISGYDPEYIDLRIKFLFQLVNNDRVVLAKR